MCQEAAAVHSKIPAAATSRVPSASDSTIHKEFAEVHFSIATLRQELLCYVLKIFVVLTNFGGNILLPQFI